MTDTNDVRFERVFTAPLDLIWDMWTDADHLASWYGPIGAEIPRAEMAVEVGGARRITMSIQIPDGSTEMYYIVGTYLEVAPKTRLVYTEAMADEDGNPLDPEQMRMPEGMQAETKVVVELEDLGNQTRMVMQDVGVDADSLGALGWQMAMSKLEERLA